MFKRDLPVSTTPSARRSPSPAVGAPQSPTLPPLEDIDKKFAEAEVDRRRDFADSRSQQKLAFLQLVASQQEVEDKRDEQFSSLLALGRQTYVTNRAERHKTFESSLHTHASTFGVQENIRNELFLSAQAARDAIFRQSQEQRLKRTEWFVQQRDRVFEHGRTRREQLGDRLTLAISDQFNALFVAEEASFALAQKNYNEQVKDKVLQVNSLLSTHS